jgi:hypothetical protein
VRARAEGETIPGGLTFNVLPSAAAVAAAAVCELADGLVVVWGVCVQATPAINKARLEPRQKNFIKQISKDVAGGMLRSKGLGTPCTHMASGIVSEFHT